ncbi:MAG: chorismate mutase [Clostridiales bacterium]|jgi:shikimate kinase|nr:chorismate mutase [Clostridiales bacterium]
MNINETRNEIDKIDGEIARLFERRMLAAGKISAYKKANRLPLYDASRERDVIEGRAAAASDALRQYVKQLFQTLTALSKGYQLQSVLEKNIVLIGMMGSGKSEKGRLLAERAGMRFIDSDEEIAREQGMTVPEIFAQYGEREFRLLESKKIAEIAALKRHVIATGGGVPLCDGNMEKLKEGGVVVFLHRDIDETARTLGTAGRPLLQDGAEVLYALYRDRLPLYRKWRDVECCASGAISAAVDEVITALFEYAIA